MNANPDSASPAPGPPSANEQFLKQVSAKRAGLEDSDQEQTLWKGGYSAKAMLGTWIAVVIAAVGLIVASTVYTLFPLVIALGISAALFVIVGCIYAYRRLGYHYELTSQRFIHQVGVLSRKTDRIEVIDIDDVSFFQGPVQRILGIGTIDITGSDRTHPRLMMRGIPDVKAVAGLIDDVRRKERKRRSLHIQSM
ncbi:MAG: PH domain-containing protein [Planctomycetaceae bacterium]